MTHPFLPYEILTMIVRLVSDGPTVYNLLFASHLFRSITEPILYGEISLRAQEQQRIQQFKAAIENKRLAKLVRSFSSANPSRGNVFEVFPLLVNLHRLSFEYTAYEIVDIPPDVLSSLTHLTHLSWHIPISDVNWFVRFLEAQPLLEYLNVTSVSEMNISPDAIPRLRYLSARQGLAISLLPGREIQHLGLHISAFGSEVQVEDISRYAVKSLFINGINYERMVSVAAHFPSLKHLQINLPLWSTFTLNSIFTPLNTLAPIKVELISIVVGRPVRSHNKEDLSTMRSLCDEVAEALPTLRLLEWVVGCRPGGDNGAPSAATRYRMNLRVRSIKVDPSPYNHDPWALWWQE